jgi:CheY-like chemotaxis protein
MKPPTLLRALGHAATVAASGEEALAQIQAGLKPDLVLLDMNMPGLGGEGTLPRLRSLFPRLPIILATGRVDQTALDLVASDADTLLLPKPFTMQAMRMKIAAATRGDPDPAAPESPV